MSDMESADYGLKFSNNEVCYPATLIVGDVVKAFRSGKYNPDESCIAITQTGGQCRASNYLPLIRKALIENGFTNTPVVSVSFDSGIENNQPGFKINWLKLMPMALAVIIFGDSIAKMYHSAIVRTKQPESVSQLRDKYMDEACRAIEANKPKALYELMSQAAAEFNALCDNTDCPKVGIVGEIFLKFHPFAQKNVTQWLIDRKIEVEYPMLTDFFLQAFVNYEENKKAWLMKTHMPGFLPRMLYSLVRRQLDRASKACARFRFFTPFEDIYEKARLASSMISLHTQFGEGWLIAGEMATFAQHGVNHVVSLQPFGCIANHIVEKGIENKIKRQYPKMNILSLDFDSSVSEVNITNRMLLFIDSLETKPSYAMA